VFAQVAQPVHVPALEEIEKQFMTEFDYVQEAEQLESVRNNLARAGLEGPGKLCRVPKAYLEYCTTRVLVMEELKGGKLADGLKNEMRVQAAREGKTEQQYLTDMRKKEAEAKEKRSELKGPTVEEYDMYISLLDKKRRLLNTFRHLHNWTIGWLPSMPQKQIEKRSDLPINHARMIDDILLLHGHEILVDGYFNGDPHPGNLLLLQKPDGSPQIGLIDYGQVKRLDKQTRHLFAKLIIALDDEDKEAVVQLMKDAGMRTKNMNPDVIYLYAKVSYDEISDQILKGKHVQLFMEDLESQDPIVQLPRELLMVSRCSLIIRGLAQALHQNRRVAKAWRPIAEQVLSNDI
jgi:aarF domain-containing kinase